MEGSPSIFSILINSQECLVDVTAHRLIGSTPTHLGAVEVLGPTGTVGPATGLLAPTFDKVCNCGWSWRISCWDWH